MSDKTPVDNLKDQLDQSAVTPASPDRQIVEDAIAEAKNSNTEAIYTDLVVESLKKIRQQSEPEYCKYRGELKAFGYSVNDLNRLTKIYKKRRKPEGSGEAPQEGTKADLITQLILQNATLFHNAKREAFVHCKVENPPDENGNPSGKFHHETWELDSNGFRDYASGLFWREYKTGIGETAFKDAKVNLSAQANQEGEETEVNLRYAMHENVVYVDIGDPDWQVVQIDKTGWQIKQNQEIPVRFTRNIEALPLAIPKAGADIADVWEALNVQNNDDLKYMLTAWLIDCMLPDTDYLLAEIGGEAGSAKSVTQDRIKSLLDNWGGGNLMVYSGEIRDIPVIAKHTYLVSFENVSSLSNQVQDRFCSCLTGSSSATRSLHTTADIAVWNMRRPVIINGIVDLVTRPDLLQRTLSFQLPAIAEYKSKRALKADWEEKRPMLQGALYDLLSKVLLYRDQVGDVVTKARQTDFMATGQAMFKALGVDGSFIELYERFEQDLQSRSINASPVALAIIKMMDDKIEYKGTATQLIEELTDKYKPKYGYGDNGEWTNSPLKLGKMLERLAKELRAYGIGMQKARGKNRVIYLKRLDNHHMQAKAVVEEL